MSDSDQEEGSSGSTVKTEKSGKRKKSNLSRESANTDLFTDEVPTPPNEEESSARGKPKRHEVTRHCCNVGSKPKVYEDPDRNPVPGRSTDGRTAMGISLDSMTNIDARQVSPHTVEFLQLDPQKLETHSENYLKHIKPYRRHQDASRLSSDSD